jgi:hypothetical protein
MVASAAATWAIVIVVVLCLAFWLVAVEVFAPRSRRRNVRLPRMTGPVLGGMHLAEGGRSVAPNRDAPALLTDEEARLLRIADGQQPLVRPRVPSQGMPARRSGATVTTPATSVPAAGATVTTPRPPSQAPLFPGQRTASHDEPVTRDR